MHTEAEAKTKWCEKGANRIGASRLQQIADILDVPVAFFFEAKVAHGAPDPAAAFMTDRHGVALLRVWAKVPEATRAALVTVAEAAVVNEMLPRAKQRAA